jgi:primosomal protein N'
MKLVINSNFEVEPAERLSKEDFINKYLALVKTFATYNAEKKRWSIRPTKLHDVIKIIMTRGYEVSYPNMTDEQLVQSERQLRSQAERVTVQMLGDKIAFRIGQCERMREFNEIFDNKSGILSGITEYDPRSQARLTSSFSLAHEAIDVLVKRNFTLMRGSSFDQAYQRWFEREEKLREQDPEILSLLAPGTTLYQHQNKAVQYLDKTNGCALLGIAMGGGKSLISLAWAAKHGLSVAVVCPKVVRRTWIQEAQRFFGWVGLELETKKRTVPCDVRIVSVNYESLAKHSEVLTRFDVLIVDESQSVMNPKAARSREVQELSRHFRHRILLSGTAVKNKREEIFHQLNIVNPEKYCVNSEIFGLSHGAFWHAIERDFLSMPKSDILRWLPAKTTIRHDRAVECPTDLPESIEEITQARHDAALSKVDITCELIEQILKSSDSSILVGSEFIDVCEAIAARFQKDAVFHHGQLKHEERERLKTDFQAGKQRVFVSTRPSLAVGATLTIANVCLFNDLPWNGADIDQFSDRTHRIGQHKPVSVYWVIAANSLFDVRLVELISQKYEIQKMTCEGKQLSKEDRDVLAKPMKLSYLIKPKVKVEESELW